MNEDFINVFVSGLTRYLDHLPNVEAEVGTPYLLEGNNTVSYDITGIIGVTGKVKGCVYFTAPHIFLSHLLMIQEIQNLSRENLLDLAGEIANTISGNARSSFGEEFEISVPVVVEGKPKDIYLVETDRSFAIPITWRSYTPLLVVSVKDVVSID